MGQASKNGRAGLSPFNVSMDFNRAWIHAQSEQALRDGGRDGGRDGRREEGKEGRWMVKKDNVPFSGDKREGGRKRGREGGREGCT